MALSDIIVEPFEIYLDGEGASERIVLGNYGKGDVGTGWEFMTNDYEWCTVEITDRYSMETTAWITADKNPSSEPRTMTYNVLFNGDNTGYEVIVEQAGSTVNYTYSVTPTTLYFGAIPSAKVCTLTTNSPYSWTIKTKSNWLTATISSGIVTITPQENTAYTNRTGYVILGCGSNFTQTINITQEAAVQQTTVPPDSPITIGSGSSASAIVVLESNYDAEWSVESTPEWLTATISEKDEGESRLVLTTKIANNTTSIRSGNVIIKADNGDSYTIVVNQTSGGIVSNVTPSYVELSGEGETVELNLTANWGASWSVQNLPTWTTSAITGNYTNSAVLKITASKNTTPYERQQQITVKNDKKSHTVTLVQDGGGWDYTLNQKSLTFTNSSTTKTSTITSNGNGTYTVYSKPNWTTVNITTNGTTASVAITTTANTSTDTRSGNVVITANNGSQLTISVSQTGVAKTTDVSSLSTNIGSAITSTASITLTANYNCEWTFDEDSEWFDCSISNNRTQNATLNITTTVANNTIYTRSAPISLYGDNGDEYKITVTQLGAAANSTVFPLKFEGVNKDGETVTANLTANWGASWTTSNVPSWVTATISKNQTNNAVLTIVAAKNTQASERSGSFIIANEKKSFVVNIQQDAADWSYNINPESLSFSTASTTKTVTLTANGSGSYSVYDKPSWITVGTISSGSSVVVNITASANASVDTRSGYVVFSTNNGGYINLAISQSGVPKATSISPTTLTIGSASGNKNTVALTSNYNCNWSVESAVEWLTTTITSNNTKNGVLTIAANQTNPTTNNRSGRVTVVDDIGNEYYVQVTQQASSPTSNAVPRTIEDGYEGGTESVSLTANWGANWVVNSKPSWVTTSITNNKTNNAILLITINKNNNAIARDEKINISNDYHSYDIRIIQDGCGWSYSVNTTSLSYTSTSATKTVTLTANGDASYTVSEKPDWITTEFSSTNGSSVGLNLTASANDTTDTRNGVVKIKTNNNTYLEVSVSQTGVAKKTYVDKNEVTIGSGETSTATVELSANYNADWSIDSTVEWLGCSLSSEVGKTSTLTITTKIANNTTTVRSGKIYVTADNGDEHLITVKQTASNPYSTVIPSVFEIGNEGDKVSATLTANWGAWWDIKSKPNWVTTSIDKNGTNSATLSITVSANTIAEERNEFIELDNGNKSFSIRIKQDAADYNCTLSPSTVSINKDGGQKTISVTANANTEYNVISKPDWVTVSFTNNNTQNVSMVLKINANTVVDTRKGSVVIESNYKGDKLTCSITQTGVDMQTNVAPLDINVGSGFTSTIPVVLTANYNCDWTVENTIYWLDAEIVNDKTQSALCNITVNEKNPLSTERRGKVLLYDDIGNEYIVWVIQEKGAITSSLSTQYIEIPKVGGEETITLTANFNATWELVDKSEWCYATFNGNGTPNGSVKIVVIPNDRQSQREGFVKIKNNYHNFTIRVAQDGADAIYWVEPIGLSFDGKGGTSSAALKSNGYGYYQINSKPDWVDVEFENNGSEEDVIVNVTAHPSDVTIVREGSILFTPNNGYTLIALNVTQTAGVKEYSVETNYMEIPSTGGTFYVNCSCNIISEWVVSNDGQSFYQLQLTGGDTKTPKIQIDVRPNTFNQIRESIIYISADNDNFKQTLTIRQLMPYDFIILPQILVVDNKQQNKTISLSTNYDSVWTLKPDVDWLTTSIKGVKPYLSEATVSIAAYGEVNERVGHITAENDKGVSEVITITQKGETLCTFEPDAFEEMLHSSGGTLEVNFKANYECNWAVTSNVNWLNATYQNGLKEGTISINVGKNEMGETRYGDITMTTQNGNAKTYNITQKAKQIYLVNGSNYIELPSSACTKDALFLTSNYETLWEVKNDSDWLTATIEPNPSVESKLVLTATANNTKEVRKTKLTITANKEFECVITVVQEQILPEFNPNYWSIPPMFMDGIDDVLYINNSGETAGYADSKIIRQKGEYNHALCPTPYYDSDIKLCFKDAEDKPVDGSNVLVFYDKPAFFADDFWERYLVNITDDIPEMMEFNEGKSCWIHTLTEVDTMGNNVAKSVVKYPRFSRYEKGGKSFNIGNPIETFTLDYDVAKYDDIYKQYWNNFLKDQFSRDTRVLECSVKIPFGIMQDFLRNFFYFDGSYWILIEVIDYNLEDEDTTKCKFVKVNNIDNYLS